jgi:PAS domain-containing protein
MSSGSNELPGNPAEEAKLRERVLDEAVAFRLRLTESEKEREERFLRERALAHLEGRFSRLFQTTLAPALVCTIRRDRHGETQEIRVQDVNPAFERLAGAAAEEIRGKVLSEAVAWAGHEFLDACEGVGQRGDPVVARLAGPKPGVYYEVALSRPKLEELAVLFVETSQYIREEELLRWTGVMFSDILNAQGQMVCRYASDGSVVFANEAYRERFSHVAGLLKSPSEMSCVVAEDREGGRAAERAVTAENPVATFECRVTLPTGEERRQAWRLRGVVEKGKIVQYEAVGRDVTAEAAQAERVAAAQRGLESRLRETQASVAAAQREVAEEQRARRAAEESLRAVRERLKNVMGRDAMPEKIEMCGHCKRIVDDKAHWIPLEIFMRDHSDIGIKVSICPYCKRKRYPGIFGDANQDTEGQERSS